MHSTGEETDSMSKVIGIDLGTTNSCVAVVEGGKPVVITNAEGERTTPSVVAFTKDGERLVGGAAKRQIATNSGRTISSIKRHMGSDYRVHIDGKDLTPQEISAMILAKIRRDAESYLGEPVTEAVITVPAYFDDSQRKATQDAGRIAGLNVLRIINEPTAAAVAYGLDNEAAQKILVYDLGGGTFDVSIIEIEDGTFTVLATGGDTHLGGDDFDQRIVEYAVAEFKKSDRIDLSRDPAAMGRLKEEAEKAKKELSAAPSAQLNLPFIAVGKDGPHHLDISLSRPQFEMMTGDLLARTVAPVQNALRDAGISASQLGKVLLVGGSTRMPAVERQVKELLGCEPSHSLNPDECVAMGAAVQGALLQGGGKLAGATGAAAQGLVLMDVTPLTLSIETLGGVATPLITRNSMIPTRKSQIFTTARPMQTSVEINVLQGERHFARDNKSLGKFKLNGIRASFSSKPQIEVTFDIDVNGVVKVSAKDLATGREQNITITGSTNLSENEIQRAMADAAAYEAEDSRRKERLELHNQAEVLAYKVDEALSKCKKELDKDEKARVKADLANLRRCLRKDKPEKMNETEEAALRQAKSQLEASATHKEADAGTGDVEAFGKAEELHAHIHGTGRVEEAVAHGPVKDDVAVGVVVDDEDVVLLCKGHQLGVQLRRAHAAHRVCGQGDDHVLCLAGHILRDILHIRQEAMLFGQRVIPGFCAAQQTACNEHRVAGGGQQHGVALIAQHHADVAHALLTAGAAGHLIRRDLYAEAALVVAAHSIQQLRQVAQAVLPVLRVGSGIHHGLADVLGGRKVRRADAQIINGAALSFQSYLAFVQCGEDLVAEQVQSFGKFHDTIPLKSSCFQHEPF